MPSKDNIWLLNFSATSQGGGLRRLIETAKWLDKLQGGVFIINSLSYKYIQDFSVNNKYIVLNITKFSRLFNEGYYLCSILKEIGIPEVYYSYGIPIKYNVGKVNWYHISNALSLNTHKIEISLLLKIKMSLLKYRIYKSLDNIQIITADSEYTINLFKQNFYKKSRNLYFDVLPNGVDDNFMKHNISDNINHFALTIGTYRYKKLEIVYKLFKYLKQNDKKLTKLFIIGNKSEVPICVKKNNDVVVDVNTTRETIVELLCNAEIYISASQIESSSIAVLEGLMFSKSVLLSDIPSHREILQKVNYEELYIKDLKSNYLKATCNDNKELLKIYSWNNNIKKYKQIINGYYKYKQLMY